MACNLLHRLFGHRTSQLPVSAAARPPALPVHSDASQLQESVRQLDLNRQTPSDLISLGSLPEQGTCTLLLADIPFGTGNVSIDCIRDLAGFIGTDRVGSHRLPACVDILVHFSTAAEAAQAMSSNLTVTLENGAIRRLQPDNRDHEIMERAAKRQKVEPPTPPPKCLVCCEELTGPHIRPCLFCDNRWCHECLKRNFSVALSDAERFPAQCCGRVIHYDVAREILPPPDLAKYRSRFEEHSITKPVYCANPTCSTFLPPRIAKPDKRGRVVCPSCESVTCGKCNEVVLSADLKHTCTVGAEIAAMIKQFQYKRCPRCSTGVAQMFGCSHIRCRCGAHWCWDCQRAMHICWSRPCERAREDEGLTDDDNVFVEDSDSEEEHATDDPHDEANQPMLSTEAADTPVLPTEDTLLVEQSSADQSEVATTTIPTILQPSVDEVNTSEGPVATLPLPDVEQSGEHAIEGSINNVNVDIEFPIATVQNVSAVDNSNSAAADLPLEYRPPAALAATPVALSAQETATVIEEFVNLDAPDQDNWQSGEYDFGDEPLDESWDTWGCLHHFTPITQSKIHYYWLPVSQDNGSADLIKKVDCLRCYNAIAIGESASEEALNTNAERKDSGVELATSNLEANAVQDPAATITGSVQVAKQSHKNEKDKPKLFNCTQCGIVLCFTCKRITARELRDSLASNTVAR